MNTHFYHKLKRKYVTLFGSIFNDITFIRYKTDGSEIERMKVPIVFAPREKFMVRLAQDPTLEKSTQLSLPVMSFNITNMMYDPSRKAQSLTKNPSANGIRNTQYRGVPYDITFELTIITRNIDDGNQIVEQILPMFNPDYNASLNIVSSMGYIRDIPVILNDVSEEIDYEGDFDSFRSVINTLTFTMKVDFYGPVSTAKIIKKVYANTYLDAALSAGGYISKMNISGSGEIALDDVVYQGDSLQTASAAGIILSVNQANTKLEVGGVQGNFVANQVLHMTSTNAHYTLVSFDATPRQIISIKTVPDPINANTWDDYGYTQTITEY